MTRKFVIHPQTHDLLYLAKEDMDKLYDTPRTSDTIGIPSYYSLDGRIWPIILVEEKK